MPPESNRITDQRRAFAEYAWREPSLRQTLAGISAVQAAAYPPQPDEARWQQARQELRQTPERLLVATQALAETGRDTVLGGLPAGREAQEFRCMCCCMVPCSIIFTTPAR